MKFNRSIVNVLSVFLGTSIFWLILIQLTFYLIQKNQAENFARSIHTQFRQELDYSNFHFLSRSLTDLTQARAITCLTLYDKSEEKKLILDLKYKGIDCDQSDLWLNGSDQNIELTTLNGDIYNLSFRSVNQSIFYFALWIIRILGIMAIGLAIILSILIKRNAEMKLSKRIELAEFKAKLARQVAHDIRSPIGALTAVAFQLGDNHPGKELLQSASKRIITIANDLLKSSKSQSEKLNNKFSPVKELKKIVDEKRILHPAFTIKMENKITEEFQLSLPLDKWQRIISNLLNNAIEASTRNLEIYINIHKKNSFLIVEIQDFGSGVPEEILKRLGKEEVSTKGEHGNGIGLYEAFKQMKSWNSELLVESKAHSGTKVQLIFVRSTFEQ